MNKKLSFFVVIALVTGAATLQAGRRSASTLYGTAGSVATASSAALTSYQKKLVAKINSEIEDLKDGIENNRIKEGAWGSSVEGSIDDMAGYFSGYSIAKYGSNQASILMGKFNNLVESGNYKSRASSDKAAAEVYEKMKKLNAAQIKFGFTGEAVIAV